MPYKLSNLRRRVAYARRFPDNTCPASRHLHLIAEALVTGRPYSMLIEEPAHCAETMLAVLESLWKARTKLAKFAAREKPIAAFESDADHNPNN